MLCASPKCIFLLDSGHFVKPKGILAGGDSQIYVICTHIYIHEDGMAITVVAWQRFQLVGKGKNVIEQIYGVISRGDPVKLLIVTKREVRGRRDLDLQQPKCY